MTNPELERERGEQKYDIRRATELLYDELGQYLEEVIGDDGFLILLSALTKAHQAVSSKAAEAPGGQRAEGCSCGSHDLAPLYHHPKCALAPTAPSERARFVEWYAKWPKGRPTSDGLTVPEIIEAAEAYAEYVSGATPSLSEERERFKKWAVPKPWYTPAIFAYGEKEGEFADALVQEFWECWRAGLSSQEGK